MYAAEWPCCHDPLRFSLGSDDLSRTRGNPLVRRHRYTSSRLPHLASPAPPRHEGLRTAHAPPPHHPSLRHSTTTSAAASHTPRPSLPPPPSAPHPALSPKALLCPKRPHPQHRRTHSDQRPHTLTLRPRCLTTPHTTTPRSDGAVSLHSPHACGTLTKSKSRPHPNPLRRSRSLAPSLLPPRSRALGHRARPDPAFGGAHASVAFDPSIGPSWLRSSLSRNQPSCTARIDPWHRR